MHGSSSYPFDLTIAQAQHRVERSAPGSASSSAGVTFASCLVFSLVVLLVGFFGCAPGSASSSVDLISASDAAASGAACESVNAHASNQHDPAMAHNTLPAAPMGHIPF